MWKSAFRADLTRFNKEIFSLSWPGRGTWCKRGVNESLLSSWGHAVNKHPHNWARVPRPFLPHFHLKKVSNCALTGVADNTDPGCAPSCWVNRSSRWSEALPEGDSSHLEWCEPRSAGGSLWQHREGVSSLRLNHRKVKQISYLVFALPWSAPQTFDPSPSQPEYYFPTSYCQKVTDGCRIGPCDLKFIRVVWFMMKVRVVGWTLGWHQSNWLKEPMSAINTQLTLN